ncbi:phospholipid scramblase 1 [Platysternon megacephalum]|uniref:Phospholipid scramblase 1 n=1 Tax=Platysternon megacephalum TaxID=55544 RepID=A0A4D9EIW1_9SAUR|nr:phospholipid scramblase 1 [Platysternon megacephalum]
MAFVKSGWLLRQSTILRRWKKNWFDLWSDGHLLFYDDQQRHDIEDKVHMRVHCINIRVGNECRGYTLAQGYVGSEVMYDETAISSAPPPYTAYATPSPEVYGYEQYNGAYPPPGPQVIYASNGQAYAVPYQYPYQGPYGQPPANHVIIRERYRDNDGDLALGMLAGAATGMALGSLFWVF